MALLTVEAKDVRGVGCNKRGISGIILRPSKAHSHSVSAAPLTLKEKIKLHIFVRKFLNLRK